MHGGAAGSGAPRGNKNARKSGLFTREEIAKRKHMRDLLRQSRKVMMQLV
jgi:glucans biosynthesis protein